MSKLTLSERTLVLMSDLGVDQSGLAKYAKVTRGAVNQWTKSKPKATMNPAVAYRIADKSDYEPRWLILGEGNKFKIADSRDAQILIRALPHLSADMRENWIEHAEKVIARSDDLSKKA